MTVATQIKDVFCLSTASNLSPLDQPRVSAVLTLGLSLKQDLGARLDELALWCPTEVPAELSERYFFQVNGREFVGKVGGASSFWRCE